MPTEVEMLVERRAPAVSSSHTATQLIFSELGIQVIAETANHVAYHLQNES